MSPPEHISTTMGKELTLMVAQPIPARLKRRYIAMGVVPSLMKEAAAKFDFILAAQLRDELLMLENE